MHEGGLRTRVVQVRFAQTVLPVSLETVEVALANLPATRPGWRCNALCLRSAQVTPDGVRSWCLELRAADTCLSARAEGEGTRFFNTEGVPSPTVVAALWALLDPQGARDARNATDEEVMALAEEEEATFTPRWTLVAGARTAIVTSDLIPVFSYGAQAGFRYWANYYLLPGAALEYESLQLRARALSTLALQGRLELAVWSDDNLRFLNLPALTFLMSVAPILALDTTPVVGGRAMVGVHLGHLGRVVLPFFFEAGFQWLKLPERDVSGLRVALGVGF
jgi:hypothetical protein